MKYFVFFALFFAVAKAIDPKVIQDIMEKVTNFAGECMEETKASPGDISTLMAHQIPETKEGKCMISCIHKAFKIQNNDGTFNADEIKKLMEKIKDDKDVYDKLMTVYNKCTEVVENVSDDHCASSANLAKCALTEGKAVGLKAEMFG